MDVGTIRTVKSARPPSRAASVEAGAAIGKADVSRGEPTNKAAAPFREAAPVSLSKSLRFIGVPARYVLLQVLRTPNSASRSMLTELRECLVNVAARVFTRCASACFRIDGLQIERLLAVDIDRKDIGDLAMRFDHGFPFVKQRERCTGIEVHRIGRT